MAVVQYLFGGIRLSGPGRKITSQATLQLSLLVAAFVLLKAVQYWYDRYELLFSNRGGTFTGASYTDINAVLPAKLILMLIAAICAIGFVVGAFTRSIKLPAIALGLLVLSSVLIGGVWPLVLQQVVVNPERHQPGTGVHRAEHRRHPDRVPDPRRPDQLRRLSGPAHRRPAGDHRRPGHRPQRPAARPERPVADVHPAAAAAELLRIPGPAGDGPLHGERSDPGLRGRGPRAQRRRTQRRAEELDQRAHGVHPRRRLRGRAGEHCGQRVPGLRGLRPGRAGAAAGERRPSEIPVSQPRTYYGQLVTDYAIVGSDGGSPREYDTDSSRYTYTGSGGVPVGNLFQRAVFATEYGEQNFLFSSEINANSKIMYNRDPIERVQVGGAVPDRRHQGVSGGRGWADRLDRRCVHDGDELPVRAAGDALRRDQ